MSDAGRHKLVLVSTKGTVRNDCSPKAPANSITELFWHRYMARCWVLKDRVLLSASPMETVLRATL